MLTGKKCHSITLRASIAFITTIFISGCAITERDAALRESNLKSWAERLRQAQLIEPPPTNPAATPLSQLIDDIDRRPLLIQTVSAKMSVQIVQAGGKTTSLSGQYIGDSSGNFRLKLTGIFGIVGLDLCARDGQITGYLPTKKIAFQCTREQIEASPCLELILLTRIGQARELFFPRAWDAAATGRRVKQGENDLLEVDVFSSKSDIPLRKTEVDPERKAVIAQNVFKCDGAPIGQSHYSKYVSCASMADSSKADGLASALPVPTAIHTGTAKVSFDFTLESLNINQELGKNAFELRLPEHLQLTAPADLSREGSSLFSK
jgi:hypothetical protein